MSHFLWNTVYIVSQVLHLTASVLTLTSFASSMSSFGIFLIFPVDSCLLIAYSEITSPSQPRFILTLGSPAYN